jgi:hypothetical protein
MFKPQLHIFEFTDSDGKVFGRSFIAMDFAGAWVQAAQYAGAVEGASIHAIESLGFKDVVDIALEAHEESHKSAMAAIGAPEPRRVLPSK